MTEEGEKHRGRVLRHVREWLQGQPTYREDGVDSSPGPVGTMGLAIDTGRHRRSVVAASRRVVVKLGTAVLTRETREVALSRCYGFVESLANLVESGRQVLVVTSGAVGLGTARLGLDTPLGDLAMRRACAAVGQVRLMAMYAEAFERLGLVAAQVLLTREDFGSLQHSRQVRQTLRALISTGVVPVINENDTVANEEESDDVGRADRAQTFGDNDGLSALVAGAVNADALVILTDVDGLYTSDPRREPDARLLSVVERVTPSTRRLAGDANGGRGGMRSKVAAAEYATTRGCHTIVANGRLPGVIDRIFAGEHLGTWFQAVERETTSASQANGNHDSSD